MEIKLDQDQMRAIVAKAILDGLGDEQRQLIITAAVEHLLGQPEERGYASHDKRNRLQRIFDQAAEHAMQQMAREEFAKPENMAKFREVFGPIVERVLSDQGAYIARCAIGNAITEAFNNKRSE